MKKEEPKRVITYNLRETMKSIVQKEMEKLPELLEGLEPKERLNILCKLMPFVFPKVEAIHPTTGEPFTPDF